MNLNALFHARTQLRSSFKNQLSLEQLRAEFAAFAELRVARELPDFYTVGVYTTTFLAITHETPLRKCLQRNHRRHRLCRDAIVRTGGEVPCPHDRSVGVFCSGLGVCTGSVCNNASEKLTHRSQRISFVIKQGQIVCISSMLSTGFQLFVPFY